MNRKGDTKMFIAMGFLFIFIITLFFLVSLIWPIGISTINTVSTTFSGVAPQLQSSTSGNELNATVNTIDNIDDTASNLGFMPYIILFGSVGLFMILAFNVRGHPMLMVLWLAIIVIMTIGSMVYSNIYEQTVNSSPSLYLNQDPFVDFLNRYLPYVVVGIGLIGGLILFILIPKEPEYEVQIA